MRRAAPVLVVFAIVVSVAPASAQDAPIVGAYTASGIDVSSAVGAVLHSFPEYDFFSLDGNVFAGSRHTHGSESVFGFDATTGARTFRIPNAFDPVVTANGRKVGFLPDRFGNRDPYATSVWMRTATGRVVPVVRFTGPRATADARGIDGDGVPLSMSWSANGNRVAVAFGNDVDLFIYDVWVVNTRTREATRVTRGLSSRFPGLSPSGDRLAALHELRTCGHGDPPYRAGDLVVMDSDGSNRSVLEEGSCALWYTDPEWVSESEIIAQRLTRTSPGTYDVDLVSIDASTGAVTDLVTTGDVLFFSASASLDAVAYIRDGIAGFTYLDLGGATSSTFPGDVPHLVGAHVTI